MTAPKTAAVFRTDIQIKRTCHCDPLGVTPFKLPRMKYDLSMPLEISGQATSSWPEMLLELLPPTLKIEVSSGWLVVALIALWLWRGRLRR
jgi:hypothetical protein